MKEKGKAGNRDGREKKREKRDEQTETERKREGEKGDKTKKKTERQHSRPPCIHRAIIPIKSDPPSLNGHPMNQHPASGQITGR